MAFSIVGHKTKTELVYVDELPWVFFSKEEREAIRHVEGFYVFNPLGGYYVKKQVAVYEDSE